MAPQLTAPASWGCLSRLVAARHAQGVHLSHLVPNERAAAFAVRPGHSRDPAAFNTQVRVPQRGLLLRSELVRAGEGQVELADEAEAWPTLGAARRHADALDEQQRRQRQEEEEEAGRSAIAGVSAEQEVAMAGLLLQSVAVGGSAEEGLVSGGAGGAAMSTAEGAVAGEMAGAAEGEGTSEGTRGGGGETPEGGQRARTLCELRALHLLTPWAEVQKPEDAGTPTPLCSALGARGHPPTYDYSIVLIQAGHVWLQPLVHMATGARGRLHCAACCVWRPRELLSKAAPSRWSGSLRYVRPPTAPEAHPPADSGLPSGPARGALRLFAQAHRLDANGRLRQRSSA